MRRFIYTDEINALLSFPSASLGQPRCPLTNDGQPSTSISTSHNTDSKDRPYDCPFCPKRFGRSDVRNHHARSMHHDGVRQDFLRSAGKRPFGTTISHEKAGTASPVGWDKKMWVINRVQKARYRSVLTEIRCILRSWNADCQMHLPVSAAR